MKTLIDAAQRRIPCDLILKNARFLDVFNGNWKVGDIAIHTGMIVGTDSGYTEARRVVDVKGRWVVPGFIDAHVHVESSLLTPENFEEVVLPHGTTTAICDPHELANVQGVSGIEYFLQASEKLDLDLYVMLSSCVPATHMETNGGGIIGAKDLLPLKAHSKALGLAEMMNVPGVLHADESVLEKIEAFTDRPIDGHCPLLSGPALSAYALTGISSCHESSQLPEALEKISKGMKVWIREGSVAKDLDALIPALNAYSSPQIGFCTDDRNPLDIFQEGHLDHLIRKAIHAGVPSEVVYRSASLSVARHYGLERLGAVAPGYQADLVILGDEKTCAVESVLKKGKWVNELSSKSNSVLNAAHSVRAVAPQKEDLVGPHGSVHVIVVEPGKIITDRVVKNHDEAGVARLTVLERYGKGSRPSNAYVYGFGENFKGAIASSVGHDSHNLIVAGSNTEDMQTALAHLIRVGGGFCVVKDQQVLAELPLPMGGLMTSSTPKKVEQALSALRSASYAVGCELPEPFLQLAFLSLPVIPKLKLTDQGLVDVERFEIIPVRAS